MTEAGLSLATNNRKHDSQECEQADLFFHIKSLWRALQQCHKDPYSTLLPAPWSPLPPWSRVRARGPVHLWGHRIPAGKGGQAGSHISWSASVTEILLHRCHQPLSAQQLLSRATLAKELGGSTEYELQAPGEEKVRGGIRMWLQPTEHLPRRCCGCGLARVEK